MKQVFEGEIPLCQLNVGAKKGVNAQLGVKCTENHTRSPHSVLCVTFLATLDLFVCTIYASKP